MAVVGKERDSKKVGLSLPQQHMISDQHLIIIWRLRRSHMLQVIKAIAKGTTADSQLLAIATSFFCNVGKLPNSHHTERFSFDLVQKLAKK